MTTRPVTGSKATEPLLDDRDWSKLTVGERIRQIEVEGYLVLPDLLQPEEIAALKAITSTFETQAVDYSAHQRGKSNLEYEGGALAKLIARPRVVEFLRQLFGDEVIMMSYNYAISEPGHPGISLHTDGQPYGSEIFGYEGSCPAMVRVLHYLDDLTPDVSPFRVVPRSHLSMHADANPYTRYESHPEEVMVTAKAGSAVVINHKVFHGNYPNVGDRPREMLAICYRPAWAGPVKAVEDWDRDKVDELPAPVRILFGERSLRIGDFGGGNKPTDMQSEAPGMNPSRWERNC